MAQVSVTEQQTRAQKLSELALAHHFRTRLQEFCPKMGLLGRHRPVDIDWIHINFTGGADHGIAIVGRWTRIRALIELNGRRFEIDTTTYFDDETVATSRITVTVLGLVSGPYTWNDKIQTYECGKDLPELHSRIVTHADLSQVA